MKMNNELGLYFHFPFCIRKCRYCDFLSGPSDEETKVRYAEAMIREMERLGSEAEDCLVTSVFLGGGTPSLMPVDCLVRIFGAMKKNFNIAPDAEITMEINPGTLSGQLLSFVSAYINRVSLGVQSFHDHELRILGRVHNGLTAEHSVRLLQRAGISNINVDLMSSIPDQDVASWKDNLERAIALGVPHISAYSLIIEEGTPFFELKKAGKLRLPDEEEERTMYHLTKEVLHGAGLEQYEISNYALPGYECRHNLKYWRRVDYLGLGVGAASLFRGHRFRNTRDISLYISESSDRKAVIRDEETLTEKDEVEEFMFLGLRLNKGVSENEFKQTFGKTMETVYGDVLEKHLKEQLLSYQNGRYALTDRGRDIANYVMSDYIL